jgi:hypothetical protein
MCVCLDYAAQCVEPDDLWRANHGTNKLRRFEDLVKCDAPISDRRRVKPVSTPLER